RRSRRSQVVRALWRSCAATAAQPTAFLLAKDIQGARAQPPRIAFACPRKLDYQLRDCPHKRCVTVASQHLRALPNDLLDEVCCRQRSSKNIRRFESMPITTCAPQLRDDLLRLVSLPSHYCPS